MNGYGYKRSITVDSFKVSGTSHTDFPMLIDVTLDNSHVTSADGYDVLITDSSDTALDYELESYDSGTGRWVGWVKIPTLSGTVDTDLYVYYGNSLITSDQSSNSVWNDYVLVSHDADTSDSSPIANTLTTGGTITPGDSTGKITDATYFDSSYISIADNASNSGIATPTLSAWINPTSFPTTYCPVIVKGMGAAGDREWGLYVTSGKAMMFAAQESTANVKNVSGTSTIPTASFSYLVAVYDGSALHIYVNGVLENSLSEALTIEDKSANIKIGFSENTSYKFRGIIDEARVATTVRSGDWIATEYNNQNDPSTFYTIGTEEVATIPTPYKRFDGTQWVDTTATIM